MKRTAPLLSLAALTGLLALAAAAGPAVASTHTLALSGPSTAVVGTPVVFQVTGTTFPPSQLGGMSWIDVVAIPTAVLPACPEDEHSAAQVAERGGGAILTLAMRPNKDDAGTFSNEVGATPTAAGTVLICAYTVNEEGLTLSRASLSLSIDAASSAGGGSRPAGIPDETISGIRSCQALLGRAGSRRCVRRVVRGAKARCRRLDSARARSRCLREVRRAARRHA
jgi:hypothetical protein